MSCMLPSNYWTSQFCIHVWGNGWLSWLLVSKKILRLTPGVIWSYVMPLKNLSVICLDVRYRMHIFCTLRIIRFLAWFWKEQQHQHQLEATWIAFHMNVGPKVPGPYVGSVELSWTTSAFCAGAIEMPWWPVWWNMKFQKFENEVQLKFPWSFTSFYRYQAWLDSEKISPHSNVAFTTGCDHQVLGRKLLRCTPFQNDFEWRGCTPPENYDGTREWRFGVLFSFSNRWFAGSISIFQGVSIVGNSCRYTVDIQKFAEHRPDF